MPASLDRVVGRVAVANDASTRTSRGGRRMAAAGIGNVGVGTEAILLSNEAGVNMWARGANGVDVSIGVAWDEETTTEDAVRAAEKQILTTMLART